MGIVQVFLPDPFTVGFSHLRIKGVQQVLVKNQHLVFCNVMGSVRHKDTPVHQRVRDGMGAFMQVLQEAAGDLLILFREGQVNRDPFRLGKSPAVPPQAVGEENLRAAGGFVQERGEAGRQGAEPVVYLILPFRRFGVVLFPPFVERAGYPFADFQQRIHESAHILFRQLPAGCQSFPEMPDVVRCQREKVDDIQAVKMFLVVFRQPLGNLRGNAQLPRHLCYIFRVVHVCGAVQRHVGKQVIEQIRKAVISKVGLPGSCCRVHRNLSFRFIRFNDII